MVRDLIKNTKNNIKTNKIKSLKDVYKLYEPIVSFSDKFLEIEKEVRFFLRTKMYNNKKVLLKNNHGKKIVNKLFYKIKNKPKKFIPVDQLKNDPNRAIADFISGMTDRYAINLHKKYLMNIFDLYLDKIIILIKKLNKEGSIELPKFLDGINVDIPPPNFDCDISTNVAMVLSKANKKSPIDIGNTLIDLIKNDDEQIETISVAKPGFINIKFKALYWNNFIKNVNEDYRNFGVNTKEEKRKYLIEFVSANPTGPLHVGHCRGAILGDVISNILIFNKHNVSKEYYVNDYGNQIINFFKICFL